MSIDMIFPAFIMNLFISELFLFLLVRIVRHAEHDSANNYENKDFEICIYMSEVVEDDFEDSDTEEYETKNFFWFVIEHLCPTIYQV